MQWQRAEIQYKRVYPETLVHRALMESSLSMMNMILKTNTRTMAYQNKCCHQMEIISLRCDPQLLRTKKMISII